MQKLYASNKSKDTYKIVQLDYLILKLSAKTHRLSHLRELSFFYIYHKIYLLKTKIGPYPFFLQSN